MSRAFLLVIALAGACASLRARSAANECRPRDKNAPWLLDQVESWIAPKDSSAAAMADSLRVPRARPQEIHWVDEPAVCARAMSAYRQVIGRPENSSGRAYVIRAGQAYIVLDPEFWYDPSYHVYTTAIFDSRWRLLSLLAG
jgi:hypothetical protein